MNEKQVLDVHATKSSRKGFLGLLETLFRRFRLLGFVFMLMPLALLYVFCMGLALTPGLTLVERVYQWTSESHFLVRNMCMAFSVAAGYFVYGLSLIFIVPAVNKLLPLKVKPQRSTWFSVSVIPWYYHNALTYLVRYTFLEFITPTPLNKLFFQMMGMKVGKGTMINTTNISDPCLIEIGDYVTVGGSCTLVAHYGMKGFLVIDKLVIMDNAVIGLKASLFGDVIVGKGALVKAHEVVMPKSRIPDREEKEAA